MICLPDVNLWIGLTSNRHVHHALATSWLESLADARIAFCRITELGLLRLLTNRHVMGEDVLAPSQAWFVYDAWRMDPRVDFLAEPPGLSESWRELGEKIAGGPNAWTDAYLAAFAAISCATLITLDRRLNKLGAAQVRYLL
jgi:toxin-antitoxin system PIN domain toxin